MLRHIAADLLADNGATNVEELLGYFVMSNRAEIQEEDVFTISTYL